jgi:hypothetical protein
MTGPQEFNFLCILAERGQTIVPSEEIVRELRAQPETYQADIDIQKLRDIKRRVKKKFKEQGTPNDLVDFMFPQGGKQGYILAADVTFSNAPLS